MNYINDWNIELFNKHVKKVLSMNTQVLKCDIAGEGNMNFTYRLFLEDERSIIIKQAPEFCAKFPSIPAPKERIQFEQKFYGLINESDFLKKFSPQVLASDKDENIIYMNDLGEGSDYEELYDLKKIDDYALKNLCSYLKSLHHLNMDNVTFINQNMKELNYNYIFKLPFDKDDKAIDLDTVTEGLSELGILLKNEREVIKKIHKLGDIYLNERDCLIHGDFYPRSWLKTNKGLYIIDPEFAFIGKAEFDIGVFLAHMAMCKDFKRVFNFLNSNYEKDNFDWNLALDFCATEILRRIFYVSQLPILNDLDFKKDLYENCIERLKNEKYKFGNLV